MSHRCGRSRASHRISVAALGSKHSATEIRMTRVRNVSIVFLTAAGLGLAQVPPAANPPAGGAGRGGFPAIVIGPPAAVPAEVAIPRPTAAELEQVNQAMKRLIESD